MVVGLSPGTCKPNDHLLKRECLLPDNYQLQWHLSKVCGLEVTYQSLPSVRVARPSTDAVQEVITAVSTCGSHAITGRQHYMVLRRNFRFLHSFCYLLFDNPQIFVRMGHDKHSFLFLAF